MRKVWLKLIMLSSYCFPFVYFAMYKDFTNRSMVGYLIMIITMSAIALWGESTDNLDIIKVGNVLSLMMSYFFIVNIECVQWDTYFKPLIPTQLLAWASLLNIIPQFIVIKLVRKVKKRKEVIST